MSVIDRVQQQLAEMKRLREEQRGEGDLSGGGGGGTSNGMEPRIAKLEAQMESVRADLGRLSPVPVDVATIKENLRHLPTKGFVVTTTTTAIGLLTAVIIFADKIRTVIAG